MAYREVAEDPRWGILNLQYLRADLTLGLVRQLESFQRHEVWSTLLDDSLGKSVAAIVLGVDQETELKRKQRLKREKVYLGV